MKMREYTCEGAKIQRKDYKLERDDGRTHCALYSTTRDRQKFKPKQSRVQSTSVPVDHYAFY